MRTTGDALEKKICLDYQAYMQPKGGCDGCEQRSEDCVECESASAKNAPKTRGTSKQESQKHEHVEGRNADGDRLEKEF